jgi:hypothetical protein
MKAATTFINSVLADQVLELKLLEYHI